MRMYRKTTFFCKLMLIWRAILLALLFLISSSYAEDNVHTQKSSTISDNGVVEEKELSLKESDDGSPVFEKKETIKSPRSRLGESESSTTTTYGESVNGDKTRSVVTESNSSGILGTGKSTETKKEETTYTHGGNVERKEIKEEKDTGLYRRDSESTVTKLKNPDGSTKTKTETKTTVSKQGGAGGFGRLQDTTELVKVEQQKDSTKKSASRSTTQHSLGQGQTVKTDETTSRTGTLGSGQKYETSTSESKTTQSGSKWMPDRSSDVTTDKTVYTTEQNSTQTNDSGEQAKTSTVTSKTKQTKSEKRTATILGRTVNTNNIESNTSETKIVTTNPDQSTVTTSSSLTTTKETARRSISGSYSSETNKNTKKPVETKPQEKPKGPSTKVTLAKGSQDLGLIEKDKGETLTEYGDSKKDGISYSATTGKQQSTGSFSVTQEEGKLKGEAGVIVSKSIFEAKGQVKGTLKGPGSTKASGKLSGSVNASAEARAQVKGEMGPDGGKVSAGASAFAGVKGSLKAEAEMDAKQTFLGFSVKGTGTAGFTAGIGGDGNVEMELSGGKIRFGGKFNGALGLGGNAGTSIEIDATPWYHWMWPNETPVNKATQLFADLSKKAKKNGKPFPPDGMKSIDFRDQVAKELDKIPKNKDGKPVKPEDYLAEQYGFGKASKDESIESPPSDNGEDSQKNNDENSKDKKDVSDGVAGAKKDEAAEENSTNDVDSDEDPELADLFEALLDDVMANDPELAEEQNHESSKQEPQTTLDNTTSNSANNGWSQQDMEDAMQTNVNDDLASQSQNNWSNGPAGGDATQNERNAASQSEHGRQMQDIENQGQQTATAIAASQREHDSVMQALEAAQQRKAELRDAVAGSVAGGLAEGVAAAGSALGHAAGDTIYEPEDAGGCRGCGGGEDHPHSDDSGSMGRSSPQATPTRPTTGSTGGAGSNANAGGLTPECIHHQKLAKEIVRVANQVKSGDESVFPYYKELAGKIMPSQQACMNSLPPELRDQVPSINTLQ